MELTEGEIRVLGCLVEKACTTPEQYPLSSNALRNAANQKTNRDPLADYTETEIDQIMLELRQSGLARTVVGGRANKHKHVLDEAWGLDPVELAIMSVLMVRGAQTVPELRSRTERLHTFDSFDDVALTLKSLAGRDKPFVVNIGRQSGQREERWTHLLLGEPLMPSAHAAMSMGSGGGGSGSRGVTVTRIDELEEEVAGLRSDLDLLREQFDRLCERLGETP